ncbi:hypothetical protein B0H17DRAFT_353274 [Mycena rosella]|uniref:(+)RNA virus helicase C-terminal domain-containing protein n=1 Tax=Mycena rosella TaxID=1033263 RepID=A0AAD7G5I5_MYCRO|nr:hypothetical protein B0H17DRAFT_353274 [Mycena rosella]
MQAILDQLHGSSLVQVRGTPGSGKTTLMHHLNNFILDQYPEATIVRFWSWEKPSALIPYNDSTRTIQRFETQQTPGGALKWDELTSPALSRTYLLFDDAQNTNFDHFLWGELFKTVPSNVHILLLCSYGSTWKYDPTDPNSVHGTLFEIPPTQLVGLRPTPQVKHHLLFSQKDYNQIILHRSHSSSNHHISLNQALHDRIFSACEGHIGAMSAYLGIVYAAAVTMKVETGATFSEEEFDSHQQSPYIFHQTFSNSHHTFTRGLPRPMDLIRKPDLVDALQMLLATGQLVFFNTSSTDVFLVAVTEAHLRGWVNMEKTMLPGRGLMTVATFPSSLHRAHISWMLADPHQLPDHLQTISLDGYVTLVVERFSVAALSRQDIYVPGSGPGSGVTNLGEAHWQNEFYRAALTIFPGVVMWPEYDSNRPGRIDFFVPARKWGIELLRDEHDIKEHNDRFSPGGRYHMWLQSAQIVDWIVVDFRTTNIEKSQPLMPNLVHYVFTKDFRRWDKFNNMLERITQGASLTTSTLRDLQYRL